MPEELENRKALHDLYICCREEVKEIISQIPVAVPFFGIREAIYVWVKSGDDEGRRAGEQLLEHLCASDTEREIVDRAKKQIAALEGPCG